jgi:hypothetical protein
MLHILFVILKILAIIVASILGLLLFLLLIVLFVPIRYQVDLRTKDELAVKARVNWLLRIVFVRAWFLDHKLHLKLRIFGICIYDNLRPRKPKKLKKQKTSKKTKENPRVQNELGKDIKQDTKQEIEQDVKQEIELEVKQEIEQEVEQNEHEEQKASVGIDYQAKETLNDNKAETIDNTKEIIKEKSSNFFHKIKSVFKKISDIIRKVVHLFATIKTKIKGLLEIVKTLWHKKRLIMSFLKDEINKAGLKILFHRIWEVLKHCAPKKICGFLKFGTGDPCSTGEAFALAAIFYAKYGGSLTIEPDFEDKVLEAEVMVKGRIRIFSLLIIGIRLIRNKNFSKLLKNAKQLKEEL